MIYWTIPEYGDGGNVNVTVSGDEAVIDLYAVWQANTYTIKFDAKPLRYLNIIIKSHKALPAWHAFAGAQAFVFVDEITMK